jgi:tetratricopeptide (TPR) repeat protein
VTLTNGARLGPYHVLSSLGAGGMGEVYLAHDTRLGRDVAIKALLGDHPSALQTPQQLLREARAAAALTHPHIAAIHDVIEFDGRPMIVMEYVPGQPLDEYLRATRPSVEQALDWGIQIAGALSAAHARDIIHCDIKPGNVRLMRDGTVKVLDFGVARIRALPTDRPGESAAATSATTRPHSLAAGTLPYMAPEQLLSHPVDPRTDVYALGVLLYELLAGHRPFDAADHTELSLQILSGAAPALSEANAPRPIGEIVSRAMSRLPAERHRSAEELAEALRAARTSLGQRGAGTVSTVTAGPGPSRRAMWLAVTVAATMAVAAALLLWRPWVTAPTVRDTAADPIVAVLPLRNLTGESRNDYLSVGVTDVVTTRLAAVPGARVLSASAAAPYRDGADRVARATRDLGATLLVDGSLQRAGNRLRVAATLLQAGSQDIVWSGTFDASVEDIFGLQRQLTDGLIDGLRDGGALKAELTTGDRARLGDAPTTNTDAFANFAQGRAFLERPDISDNLDRAVKLLEMAVGLDPAFALAHAALGEAYWAQYQRSRDETWIGRAREATLEALRLDPGQAGVRYSLAVIYSGTGRTEQAIEELRRAIALQPLGDDAHRLLGEIVARTGDVDGGVVEMRRAIELRPSYWNNYWTLGVALSRAGRYDAAIPPLQRVTELQPDNARGYQSLGTAYHQSGDLSNAMINYQRANAVTPTAGAFSNIGTIHYSRGEFARATQAYERAVALSPNLAGLRRNLADAYEAMGDGVRARASYTRAAEISGNAVKVNPRDARGIALLAYCEAKIGLQRDAERNIERAVALAPTDNEVLYKRAAIRALGGNTAGALQSLADAVKHGYSPTLIAGDRDLISLTNTAEYQRLVASSR